MLLIKGPNPPLKVPFHSRVHTKNVLLGFDRGRGRCGGRRDGIDGASLAFLPSGRRGLLRRRIELRVEIRGAGARLEKKGRKKISD